MLVSSTFVDDLSQERYSRQEQSSTPEYQGEIEMFQSQWLKGFLFMFFWEIYFNHQQSSLEHRMSNRCWSNWISDILDIDLLEAENVIVEFLLQWKFLIHHVGRKGAIVWRFFLLAPVPSTHGWLIISEIGNFKDTFALPSDAIFYHSIKFVPILLWKIIF